jgi:hypothetical protein
MSVTRTIMQKPQATTDEISTEWRFAVALVKHRMNATAAAREVFRLGSRQGKSAHTAESIGSEYRRKPEVRQYVIEIAQREFNPVQAARRLQEIMNDKDHPGTSLQAAIHILRMAGVYSDDAPPPVAPIVYLNVPQRREEVATE